MSDSGSDSDLSGTEKDNDKKSNKYDDKGVDQEAGLKNILDSEEEDEEEENKDKEEEEDVADKEEGKNNKKEKGTLFCYLLKNVKVLFMNKYFLLLSFESRIDAFLFFRQSVIFSI